MWRVADAPGWSPALRLSSREAVTAPRAKIFKGFTYALRVSGGPRSPTCGGTGPTFHRVPVNYSADWRGSGVGAGRGRARVCLAGGCNTTRTTWLGHGHGAQSDGPPGALKSPRNWGAGGSKPAPSVNEHLLGI